jgi:membrane-associated phospholipid phosphatase
VLVATRWSPLISLDVSAADHLDRWTAAHPAAATAWRVVTTAGQPLTWEVLAAVCATALWLRRRRRLAVFVLLAVFGSVAWYDLVKAAVGRHRPVVTHPLVHPFGASFPSGHAMVSGVAMALVVLASRQRLHRAVAGAAVSAGAVLVALAVGFSRLALAAHYPSDVLGGWLLATAWFLGLGAAMGIRPSSFSRRTPSSATRPAADRPRAG